MCLYFFIFLTVKKPNSAPNNVIFVFNYYILKSLLPGGIKAHLLFLLLKKVHDLTNSILLVDSTLGFESEGGRVLVYKLYINI